MKKLSKKGAVLAAAVASLFVAGKVMAEDKPATAGAAPAKEKMVKCEGVNACKGKGGCGGKGNSCAGKNGCAGKGWMHMTEKDCEAKGGKVVQ